MGQHTSTPKGGFLFSVLLFIVTFIVLVTYVYGRNMDALV